MEQTKTLLTAAHIKAELAGYTGTETYHRSQLYPSMLLTDGAHAFAELVGAWWLMDLIGLEFLPVYKESPLCDGFGVVTLTVDANSRAIIALEDGNDNSVKRKSIPFTDAPEGEYMFFLQQADDGVHVLMLPREY